MKKIKIQIEDSAGVEQLVDFEYRKKTHINFLDIKNKILECFAFELEKITKYFNLPLNFTTLVITLEQQRGGDGHATLACFRPEKSLLTKTYQFSFYFSGIELLGKYIDTNNEAYLNHFKDIVLHELMHALDLDELGEQHKIQELSYSKSIDNAYSSTTIGNPIGMDNNYNMQWAFLTFLKTYRAEGVAILGERLFGNTPIDKEDTTEALKAFKKHLTTVFDICGDLNYTGKLKTHKLFEIMDNIKLSAYTYADALLFEMLKKRFNKFSDIDFNECRNIPETIKNNILKEAIELDLSEYIQQLLALKLNDDSYLVDHKIFLQYCGLLQKEYNSEDVSNFLNGLIYAGVDQNHEKFISSIREIMGSPMSTETITQELKAIEIAESHDEIYKEMFLIANESLVPQLTSNNKLHNELASWSLTYFLDDQDIIHDKVKYLGFQDDWIVLNTAQKLIAN